MKYKKSKFLIHLLSLSLVCTLGSPLSAGATVTEVPAEVAAETADASQWPAPPSIASPSAFLLEATSGAVLFEQASDELRVPGSLVKLMTMLLTLENSSLTDQVTFTATGPSAAGGGAANIAVREGEVLTMEQCLYAIMLASANDVCMQVAEHVSGSVDAFVEKMNARAKELGCTNTTFINPTGLPDTANPTIPQTTAHDMALILKAAADLPDFLTISQAAEYTIPATNMTGAPRTLKNAFPLSVAGGQYQYEGILSGKAGYTQSSGSTLAAAAERNGTRLIAVVLMGADGQTSVDARTLFDYGFHQFQRVQYSDPDKTQEGGFAILPNGLSLDQITTQETSTEKGLSQTYYFQNRQVGYALLQQPEDAVSTPTPVENEAYLKSLSEKKSMTPYAVIAGVGIVLLTFLGYLLRKVLKS